MTPSVREHWGSKVGFFFAAVGSAVGLGLLWKFPFTVRDNGGGLFLLCYFGCLFLVGIPVFIGELILGRASGRASVGAYEALSDKRPAWRFTGWLGVSASFLIMSYYSVIGGWGISYLMASIIGASKGRSMQETVAAYQALSHATGITVLWHFIFTASCMGIVIVGVRKGIEHWAKIMTRILLVLLIALAIYCATLQGFHKALIFIFKPDVTRFKFSSLLEGLGLAFFTLSLGQGIMISYGSYMRRETSAVRMSAIVAGSVFIVAILAALTIFPVLFSFYGQLEGGIGLVFETLPYLFAQLPAPVIIASGFFILFIFAGITSAIPLIEVVATNYMELYDFSRKKAVAIVSALCFLFGLPSACAFSGALFPTWEKIYGSNFFLTMDNLVTVWIIPLCALLGSFFMGWIFDKEKAWEEFQIGGHSLSLFHLWRFFVRWFIPVIILLIIFQKSGMINFDAWVRI